MPSTASNLAGRRALVTGASSGIGASVAQALLQCGVAVTASGRRASHLESLVDLARLHGSDLRILAGDITDEAFRNELASQAGSPDILVNCAGTLNHAPLLESDAVDWDSLYCTNVLATLKLTQQIARAMCRRGSGHVVNIGSSLADQVTSLNAAYASTKAALRALTRGLRLEVMSCGIRVTEIAPGAVSTSIRRQVRNEKAIRDAQERRFEPLEPSDVASAVLHAVSAREGVNVDLLVVKPVGQP